MINEKQFYADASDLYFKYRDRHQTDDWEQEYFDMMSVRYDTKDTECLIHLYYHDDDSIGEVAQGIIEDLTGKTVLLSTSFDDDDNDTTVVACIVKKDSKTRLQDFAKLIIDTIEDESKYGDAYTLDSIMSLCEKKLETKD